MSTSAKAIYLAILFAILAVCGVAIMVSSIGNNDGGVIAGAAIWVACSLIALFCAFGAGLEVGRVGGCSH